MTDFEALVSLNLVGNVGRTRLNKLLSYFDRIEDIFQASPQELMAIAGIGPEISGRIRSFKNKDLEKELKLSQDLGIKIVTIEEFPQNLQNIFDPPLVLYVKGEFKKEDDLSVGIVGSRRASFYGLSCAEKFAFELAENGFTIISGLARGIDTQAHNGALRFKGRTIAVIGSGLNNIYPQENTELFEKISLNGAVVSEFPLNTEPFKQNFPRRNRLISGLSLGVLVVEAAKNSGALITADSALEQGREVFALPGKIDSPNSFGTNELIKQGAKLVSCCEEIIEELAVSVVSKVPALNLDKEQNIDLDSREENLYNFIFDDPIRFDELVEKTNLNVSKVSDLLLKLQLKKRIRTLPGKQFVKI